MEHGISCSSPFRFPSVARHASVPTIRSCVLISPLSFRRRGRLPRVPSERLLLAGERHGIDKTNHRSRLCANEGVSVVEEDSAEPSLLEQIEGFEYKEEMEYGTVVIKPLSEEWIPEASKLLADSFGETLGYRGFSAQIFRQQLMDYLKSSLELGIAGVILISVLQPNANFEAPDDPSTSGPKFQGFSFVPPPGTSIPSPNAEKKGGLLGVLGWGGPSGGAGDGKEKTVSFRDFREDLDDFNDDEIEKRWSPSEEDKKSQSKQVELESSPRLASSPSLTSPSNKGEPVSSVSNAGKQEIDASSEIPVSEDNQEQKEYLVGSVELSLDKSTRSLFNGLITPVKEGAYMCNMAVQPHFQRQGHATRLLKACEEISRVSDLEELSLHVRVSDEGAKALYRGYGFQDIKQDSGFLSIVGLDPKILMQIRFS